MNTQSTPSKSYRIFVEPSSGAYRGALDEAVFNSEAEALTEMERRAKADWKGFWSQRLVQID